MRKPRGGRRARRHQASRSTCRLAGGAWTSSTPRRSQPWKVSREAARASREFQKQRALARQKARKTARPPASSAPPAVSCPSSLQSTSASEPGASCTGRVMLRGRPRSAAKRLVGRGSSTAQTAEAPHARRDRPAHCARRRLPGERAPGGGVDSARRAGEGRDAQQPPGVQ